MYDVIIKVNDIIIWWIDKGIGFMEERKSRRII